MTGWKSPAPRSFASQGRAVLFATRCAVGSACLLLAASLPAGAVRLQEAPPPRILLDLPPQAVQYQLDRLTPGQLVQVERRDDDVRYRPIYVALLTRPGLAQTYREESLAALTKLDGVSPARVILDLVAGGPEEPWPAAPILRDLLYGMPPTALRGERSGFEELAGDAAAQRYAREIAYGAILLADDDAGPAWDLARETATLGDLLRAAPHLPGDATAGIAAGLAERLVLVVSAGITDPETRAAALTALAWARPDAATFRMLAGEVIGGADAAAREAAVRGLLSIPVAEWPSAGIELLARALLDRLAETPLEERTGPAGADALQLADALVSRLPAGAADELRAELRGLGVRVARIGTIPERMLFDRRWFVAEAGRPVQIQFDNPDAMPHNLVVGYPGSLQVIGQAASAMQLTDDPDVKPFVPNLPIVIAATGLVAQGNSERLSFIAPDMPGSYIYVCTFPGHWMLMYGVMLVVEDLEAWEANPQPPVDPMSGEPFPLDAEG
ncbi:MAG TPA: plastocyanin/azurin family copper-binding protein [Longimicrobiales bacterium]|nr:plastocyanin/azurin family copper-binding protein [Longimicrobiales bacterium]